MSTEAPKILWIGLSDPWSRWTLSGISLLQGVVTPRWFTLRHMRQPGPLFEVERHVNRWARERIWPLPTQFNERSGVVGRALRQCPPGTIVIYALLRPELDLSLGIRRFRWMDLSILDAVKSGSFGYQGLSPECMDLELADERRMLAACEGVVSLSSYAATSIARDLGYDRQRMTAIGAGPAVSVRNDIEFGEARYSGARMLFVGRDWKRKRGDLIVDAWRRVRRQVPHATLTIVGPESSPVSPEEGIEFVGPLDKGKPRDLKRLQDLYLRSSALCMASASEPWGLVYVEAAQFGLPVVALNDWALPDIVVDGVTGRLVQGATAELFAAALCEIFQDPTKAAAMGRAARGRVDEVLSWPAVVDRLLERVLPSALDGRAVVALQHSVDAYR
jgi:glycosyltransferase involved in cell wall biosynthesis